MVNRPEVEQNHISLENARLDLKGVKNNLLSRLNATATLSNAGQGWSLSAIPAGIRNPNGTVTLRPPGPGDVNQLLIGG